MKEDDAFYTLYLYQNGERVGSYENLSFREAFELYHKHDPFLQIGVDVYRNGKRLKFGEAMDKFSDPRLFVKLF